MRNILPERSTWATPKSQHAGRKIIEKVGLKEKAGQWPSQLSGGQRRTYCPSRALSHTPRILLLDEPLGALER